MQDWNANQLCHVQLKYRFGSLCHVIMSGICFAIRVGYWFRPRTDILLSFFFVCLRLPFHSNSIHLIAFFQICTVSIKQIHLVNLTQYFYKFTISYLMGKKKYSKYAMAFRAFECNTKLLVRSPVWSNYLYHVDTFMFLYRHLSKEIASTEQAPVLGSNSLTIRNVVQ